MRPNEKAEVVRVSSVPPPASSMTHVARTAGPAPDAVAQTPSSRAPVLHDGDVIEIRGARLRVIASGTSRRGSKPVAHLQLVAPAESTTEALPTHAPVLEASPALMVLIAEQFGIKENQPHRLQSGQATWVSGLINDYSMLKAGAHFHTMTLEDLAHGQIQGLTGPSPAHSA